jgi:hypothetical protein
VDPTEPKVVDGRLQRLTGGHPAAEPLHPDALRLQQFAVQLEQRAAQRSNVGRGPSARRSGARGGPAITLLRPRPEWFQICSTHGALICAVGDALGAQRTALGLGFDLRLTSEQSHVAPFTW